MILYPGQVKSITLDEIEGAYKFTIIHVGHPSNFLWVWEGLFGRSGGLSDCEELVGVTNRRCGVRLPFVLSDQFLDHKISHVYEQQVHEII